jgi:hypothetical protein
MTLRALFHSFELRFWYSCIIQHCAARARQPGEQVPFVAKINKYRLRLLLRLFGCALDRPAIRRKPPAATSPRSTYGNASSVEQSLPR